MLQRGAADEGARAVQATSHRSTLVPQRKAPPPRYLMLDGARRTGTAAALCAARGGRRRRAGTKAKSFRRLLGDKGGEGAGGGGVWPTHARVRVFLATHVQRIKGAAAAANCATICRRQSRLVGRWPAARDAIGRPVAPPPTVAHAHRGNTHGTHDRETSRRPTNQRRRWGASAAAARMPRWAAVWCCPLPPPALATRARLPLGRGGPNVLGGRRWVMVIADAWPPQVLHDNLP